MESNVIAVLRCSDGTSHKVDLDAASSQSTLMKNFSDNAVVSDSAS